MKPLGRRWHYSLLSIVLVFILTMYSTQAPAQIYWDLEVDPISVLCGKHQTSIRQVHRPHAERLRYGAVEIVSAGGSTSVFFEVGGAVKADSSRTNSELIFNKYGNRYFLEKLSDEGGLSVKLLGESGYEKRIGRAAAEAQEHVPAHHRGS
jgi:hypothetical protein